MDKIALAQLLQDKFQYSEYAARVTSEDILNMDSETLMALNDYFKTGIIVNLACNAYSVNTLIEFFELKPPAAYLAISDLRKDYPKMSALLAAGMS